MKCFRHLHYDLRNGILRNSGLLSVPVIVVIICGSFRRQLLVAGLTGTWLEYLVYCFRGCKALTAMESGQAFLVPVIWLVLFALPLLLTLQYPFQDMKTIGQQLVLRSGNRVWWWLSKCLWNFFCTVSYFILMLVCITLYCLCQSVSISLEVSLESISLIFSEVLLVNGVDAISRNTLLSATILLPFLVMAGMDLLQMLLSLLTRPIYGFLMCITLLIASSCVTTPMFIGNYGMLMRMECFVHDGLSIQSGIVSCLVIMVLSILLGAVIFKKYDILPDYKEL